MKLIPLTQGQVAIVCDCHAHLVEGRKWHVLWNNDIQQFYALRHATLAERLLGTSSKLYMHRIINNTPKGFDTDHINGNTLDNRCVNLRTATVSENGRNRMKQVNNTGNYKGVHWHKRACKWTAEIQSNKQRIYLGLFTSAESAARAYDKAAKELHGEFATLNFPETS